MYKINDSNTNHITSKLFVTIYNDYVYFKKKDYKKGSFKEGIIGMSYRLRSK